MSIPAAAAPVPSTPSLCSAPAPQHPQESKPRELFMAGKSPGLSAGTWSGFLLHTSVCSCLLKPRVLHSTGQSQPPSFQIFQALQDFSILQPLHVPITDSSQFKRVWIYLLIFSYSFQIPVWIKSHSTQTHSTTLKAGQIVTEWQKEIKYLKLLHSSIRNHQK